MSILLATYVLVFLRVFQQQNVIHRQYWQAVLTSYGLAIGEVTLILLVVQQGWDAIFYIGTGGALGVTSSMYLHKKIKQRYEK